jgi:hypothetical protein
VRIYFFRRSYRNTTSWRVVISFTASARHSRSGRHVTKTKKNKKKQTKKQKTKTKKKQKKNKKTKKTKKTKKNKKKNKKQYFWVILTLKNGTMSEFRMKTWHHIRLLGSRVRKKSWIIYIGGIIVLNKMRFSTELSIFTSFTNSFSVVIFIWVKNTVKVQLR